MKRGHLFGALGFSATVNAPREGEREGSAWGREEEGHTGRNRVDGRARVFKGVEKKIMKDEKCGNRIEDVKNIPFLIIVAIYRLLFLH